MGKADWSLDHLEQELVAGFAVLGRAEGAGRLGPGESAAVADGILQCMNGALMKVSESLEAQTRLRCELARAQEEFQRAQAAQAERIQRLEAEVAALCRNLEEERSRERLERGQGAHHVLQQSPPEEHLNRPLVLRSPQGDFLGVTDRSGQALSLAGFLRLVETGGEGDPAGERIVASCWERRAGAWSVTLCLSGPAVQPRCYGLETRPLTTPSGNKVAVLSSLAVDGSPVPAGYVVQLFRHLRESFQEE